MAPKAKKIYKNVKKQERKIAKKEVKKAKKMIHKKKKWTVAASAMGYHAGYSNKHGFMFGKGGLSSKMVQPPAQVMAVPATSSTLFKTYYDRKPIKNGLVVTGQQKLANIASDGSSNANAFTVGGSRTSSIYLSPDSIGGQMATDARNYQFYKFKKLRVIAVMSAASTDTLNVGMMFSADPQIASYQTLTYETIQQATDFVSFTRKQPNGPVVWHLAELKKSQYSKYNTELDTTNDISKRNSIQGIFYGFFDANDSANTKYGDLLIEYELALFNRTPDYGFTMSVGDQKLGEILCKDIEKYAEYKVRDCKEDEQKREIKQHLLKSYEVSMRQLKQWSGMMPRSGDPNGLPPLVAIADAQFNQYTGTRTVNAAPTTAPITSGSVPTTCSTTAVQKVDMVQIGSVEPYAPFTSQGFLPVGIIDSGTQGGVYVTNGNLQVDTRRIAGQVISQTSGVQNVTSDVIKVAGVAINTDGKTPSASLPININAINQASLANTGNPTSGAAMNGAVPVQMWGYKTNGDSVAASAFASASGTAASCATQVHDAGFSRVTDTQSVEIPSPTESLDSVVVMKVPKKKFKEAVEQKAKDQKDQPKK